MSKYEPFNGTELLDAPPEEVHAFLIDLDQLVAIVPGLVKKEIGEDGICRTTVRPGFSFIKANLKQDFQVVDHTPHERVVIGVEAKGIGNKFGVESTLDLTPHDDGGTRLDWKAEIVHMSGLVAAVGTTIIRAAADQVIKQGFEAMRKAIDEANSGGDAKASSS
ncbi:MAG: hypothetical protein CMJ34_13470 [Phycisphaerae bacterium]|nr:hypothetical protein [Phycisphaerae bacterium]